MHSIPRDQTGLHVWRREATMKSARTFSLEKRSLRLRSLSEHRGIENFFVARADQGCSSVARCLKSARFESRISNGTRLCVTVSATYGELSQS